MISTKVKCPFTGPFKGINDVSCWCERPFILIDDNKRVVCRFIYFEEREWVMQTLNAAWKKEKK
jgi:hypothetical protein